MRPRDLILHLRPHWQIMLMPLFLWGFVLAGDGAATRLIALRFWLVLFIFHVLFYGGATAMNSYYDRDQGPVGGLWDPPPVTDALLYFSVGVQILGLFVLFFISRTLFGLALIMGIISLSYSHPATRLKARPWASLLAVSVFQGMGGTAAGWLFVQDDWRTLLTPVGLLALLSAALVITGFYPLTQLYQREEDRRQGVISFAVYAGKACFPLAIGCLLAAAGLMAYVSMQTLGRWAAIAAAAGPVAMAGLVAAWWSRFDDRQVRQNYEWMMRLGYLMTGGFLSFIVWQLVALW